MFTDNESRDEIPASSAGMIRFSFKCGSAVNGNGKPFVIKNKLAVVPEVIGGNGSLKLAFNKSASSDAAFAAEKDALISDSAPDAGLEMETTSSGMPSFVLSNTDLNCGTEPTKQSNTDGTDKKMSFTFWDETEETTPGNNSQNTVIYVTDFTLALDGNGLKNAVFAY